MRTSFLRYTLLIALTIAAGSPAAAGTSETSAAGNAYMAGSNLRLDTPVAADLIAAGGQISIEREIGADAALAGGTVHVRAPVTQDLRVAGGSVDVTRDVGGDLVAAGNSVKLDDTVHVAGSGWVAGNNVDVAGTINKDAKIYGDRIALSGHIIGDARLYGRRIELAPGARIDGNLSYASASALPDTLRAQVGGTITRLETPEDWKDWQEGHGARAGAMSWSRPLFLVSMLVCGMLLYLLFPDAVAGAGNEIGRRPLRSLLTGLALMFTLPPVAILFMITVVGLPVGFALLLLYPLLLFLGYLVTAFFVGHRMATALKQPEPLSLKKEALFLALALLAFSLAHALPLLGGLLMIAVVVAGMGGWAVWAQSRYKTGKDKGGAAPQTAGA